MIEFLHNEILSSSSVEDLIILDNKESIFIENCYIDHSENEGPSYIKILNSHLVSISELDVNHLTGSSSKGKSVLFLDLHENADFEIVGCHFNSNNLKETIMFDLQSKIRDFKIQDCIFSNESLSHYYILAE